jgi:hypothetical protein
MLAPVLLPLLALAASGADMRDAVACDPNAANTCGQGGYCESSKTGACTAPGTCRYVPGAPFALLLPVPAGEAVYCAKGTRIPKSSHSACYDNTRFAVDLATPAFLPPHLVLAPREGIVKLARGGCTSKDLSFQDGEDRCNDGWGNFVRISHEDGWFTHLAHLSAILVEPDQHVEAGDIIGIEGNTGAAGSKHVHLSLHRGNPLQGPGPSFPMRLVTSTGTLDDAAFRCGNWMTSNEVDPSTRHVSTLKRRDGSLRFGYRSAFYGPSNALSLDDVAERAPTLSGDERRRAIDALRASQNPTHRYALARALIDEGIPSVAEGDRVLESLESVASPAWVRPWARMRRAMLQLDAGDPTLARKLLAEPTPGGVKDDDEWPTFIETLRVKTKKLP